MEKAIVAYYSGHQDTLWCAKCGPCSVEADCYSDLDGALSIADLESGETCDKCGIHILPEDWIRVDTITVAFELDGMSDFFNTDAEMDAECERVAALLRAEYPSATVRVSVVTDKGGMIRATGIDYRGEFWTSESYNDDVPIISEIEGILGY